MNPDTAGKEQQGPSGVPYINDPAKPSNPAPEHDPDNDAGNEDPGSQMDRDATVPLIEEP